MLAIRDTAERANPSRDPKRMSSRRLKLLVREPTRMCRTDLGAAWPSLFHQRCASGSLGEGLREPARRSLRARQSGFHPGPAWRTA